MVNWYYSLHIMPNDDDSFHIRTKSPIKAANLARWYQKSGWSVYIHVETRAIENRGCSTQEYAAASKKTYSMGTIRAYGFNDTIERVRGTNKESPTYDIDQ